ncbi:hypothetical protein HN51_051778 [Arachis hypogaea]|uniref:uncharacterized protein n=1 Tax=Arachis hypogaea TaxID=3818 RepID=UPI0007AF8F09
MEKEGPKESKEINPHAFEKLEENTFSINNEGQVKESKNNLEFTDDDDDEDVGGNNAFDLNIEQEEDISDKIYNSQNEDQYVESRKSESQNFVHYELDYDNKQVDVFPIQKVYNQDQKPKESEAQIIGHDNREEFDNEVDSLKKINEVIDIKSNVHHEEDASSSTRYETQFNVDNGTEYFGTQYIGFYNADEENKSIESTWNAETNNLMIVNDEIEYVGAQQNGFYKSKEQSRSIESTSNENNDVKFENIEIQLIVDGTKYFGAQHNEFHKSKKETESTESTSNENSNDVNLANEKAKVCRTATTVSNNHRNTSSTNVYDVNYSEEQPSMVEKAVALRNFVRQKSMVVVSSMLRHLSRKSEEKVVVASNFDDNVKDSESKKDICDNDAKENNDQKIDLVIKGPLEPLAIKGRVILYTKLGCPESREVRLFLNSKRLRYIEINIDVYTSRKKELEKRSGSNSVPKVFFNEILIGGLSELKALEESGELGDKIDYLISDTPSFQAPLPPFSGEDDPSCSGSIDELALIVCNMKKSIVVKDRFCKMRRFTNCFVGFEAVDFLSQDQYLERKEAVEFGRKLARKLFFRHVLDEHVFEDSNHLYRFLDDDPIVASCQNILRGIITTRPKPIAEIASRLRFLCYAIFEAYASEDGRHVDYRSIHGSEEFARYLRIVEELQRVELWDLSREEKLSFFINLYNMMSIHAILVWGHPDGTLEKRKFFADFRYVIGGNTYTLLAIQNGILRGNQRPPYNLMKTFSAKDKRLKVSLPYPEPLIHFALVFGSRSGPALRCYSVGDIDQELVDAARSFLKSGGLSIDYSAKVAYASKILKWFSVDFGKNEVEVLKHVSNYLDPNESEVLLDLLATCELKIIYQPYDWGLNF